MTTQTHPTDLERQLNQAALHPHALAGAAVVDLDSSRVGESLLSVHAELDAPLEPRLARLLRKFGVNDLSIPLVTGTPALRRSWFIAIAVSVLFALSVASNDTQAGVDRIVVFLALAPLLPLLGVALAFGRGVDPTHDLVVAAPRDTFAVFLVRAITVLFASSAVLLLSSLLLPTGGAYRVAWLLPALALTALAMMLSARYDTRRVAGVIGICWLSLVIAVTAPGSATDMFGRLCQIASVVVLVGSVAVLFTRRDRFERTAMERTP